MISIKHPIVELLDENSIKKAYASVNEFKLNRTIRPAKSIGLKDIAEIENVIGTFELAIVDNWQFAFDTKKENSEKKKIFHQLCKECLNLMQVMPIPENSIEKIIHVLKLLAYAYLGEKWEDMKRYIKENPKVWNIESSKDSSWDSRLFANIYLSILYLARKESWDDLSKSIESIATLRKEQKTFEKEYLEKVDSEYKRGSVLQLASLYHLAKSVELVSEYMSQGTPTDIEDRLNLHFEKAINYSQSARIFELDIILILLNSTFKKMIYNSVWVVAKRVNSRVTEFTELITKSDKPIFEFLYPQRIAILERGLLDPTSRAIIVNLPTSSGKTIMAEFRILQAINTFGDDGKIVYVVPTRTLVNQIASRLRRDLGSEPLNIKIEKMSGAVEIDSFEENLINSKRKFNVLVTTPEKLQLLIRHPEKTLAKSLVLAIIDEAHNLANGSRGLNLEMLLSTIKNDCEKANLLLLTPFIPNSEDIARWLNPQNPKSISLELDWKPNDRVVGLYYATGKRRNIQTFFKPLVTSEKTIELEENLPLGETTTSLPISEIKSSNFKLTSLIATQFEPSQNFLVLGRNPDETWKMADLIYNTLPKESKLDENITLVKKFISAELGSDFLLVKYLEKRIGIHHSGLPEEIKELMEWLMESGSLRILVATTTIAQGVNFPVSGILISSYAYPYKTMPSRDFWNLLGRAGRIDQPSLGIIGLAVDIDDTDKVIKTTQYVKKSTEELVSVLIQMIDKAVQLGEKFDLSCLAYYSEWSSFVQYIAHMKNQSKNLDQFIAESELILKKTFGYDQLKPENQKTLLEAVKKYAEKLDGKPYLSTLSDLTGFAPETIEDTIKTVKHLDMKEKDWKTDNIFSPASEKLSKLVGVMLKSIPEIKKDLDIKVLGKSITEKETSNIIIDWVSGKEITEIALEHFGGKDKNAVTDCVKALYSKITNNATWGLAAIQKIPGSGLEFDDMSDGQKRQLSNLPAMMYYGVNSEEAILMRMYNVPRTIADKVGKIYKNQIKDNDVYSEEADNVLTWLDNLPDEEWKPGKKNISGSDYKKIWRKLTGI